MELYTKLTSTLNDVFATQLTDAVQWRVVPGQMTRVSASPAGYTWGVNALNGLFVCKEPCTGSWKSIALAVEGKILDITTDAQNVYALVFEKDAPVIRSMIVTGEGSWGEPIKPPKDVKAIVATTDSLFADTDRGPFKCTTPCTTSAWTSTVAERTGLSGKDGVYSFSGEKGSGILKGDLSRTILSTVFIPSGRKVKITSASGRRVYGVDADGVAQVYYNGEWKPIPGLASYGSVSVSGEMDDTAIYATTQSGQILRCQAPCSDKEQVSVVSAQGHSPDANAPKQLTVNASSRQVWQLSPSKGAGDAGNGIFNRKDGAPRDLTEVVNPLEIRRDNTLLEIDARYERALAAGETGALLEKTSEYVRGVRPRIGPEDDPRVIRRNMENTPIGVSLLVLQIACACVLAILVVLILLPPSIAHALSFVIACVGTVAAVSFSTIKG